MNTLLLAIIAIILVGLLVLLLRPLPRVEEEQAEDLRITPLLRGINYLLSDEPDLALQEMVQVARLRSEAADVYMALGEMFRSKGEIGRAVRIHQNLLARPDIPSELRLQVHLALAKNFQVGGLLDRALYQYGQVLNMDSGHATALEASLRIREQSSEWLLAEELLSRLENVRGQSYGSHRAYLFSEVARQHYHVAGDVEKACSFVKKALLLDACCAPARILAIDIAMARQDFQLASFEVAELWAESKEHFPLVLPLLVGNERYYCEEGEALLYAFWQQSRYGEMALAWLEAIATTQGKEAVQKLCASVNFVPASLRDALRLHAVAGDEHDVYAQFARSWRAKAKNYTCETCGVEVVEVRWQCPQCHTWGTLHPKVEEMI